MKEMIQFIDAKTCLKNKVAKTFTKGYYAFCTLCLVGSILFLCCCVRMSRICNLEVETGKTTNSETLRSYGRIHLQIECTQNLSKHELRVIGKRASICRY